jgi:hypothetical protein
MLFYLLFMLLILIQFGVLLLLGGLLFALRAGFNEVIKALETVTAEVERGNRQEG